MILLENRYVLPLQMWQHHGLDLFILYKSSNSVAPLGYSSNSVAPLGYCNIIKSVIRKTVTKGEVKNKIL